MNTVFLIYFLLLTAAIASKVAEDGSFHVKFRIQVSSGNVGEFVVKVDPTWAPKGAARFRELVGIDFFKVVFPKAK